MLIFCHIVLWFTVYSFIGWVYESILCSITEKSLVNRGFLNGPVCPIYGVGALLIIWMLSPAKDNIITLFFSGIVVTMVLEYITSYLLEKLFHTQWWDYSRFRFNLNGRICLLGAVVFGIFSVLLLRLIHPLVSGLVDRIPDAFCIAVSIVLLNVFIADTIVTVISILNLNEWLQKIQLQLNKLKEEASEHLQIIFNKIQDKRVAFG